MELKMSRANGKQAEEFKEAAYKVDADQSDDALDRIMDKLDLTKKPEPEKTPKAK